jgi:hypothetical protein
MRGRERSRLWEGIRGSSEDVLMDVKMCASYIVEGGEDMQPVV